MKTLKEHREAAGLSMRAFAAQAGVSTRTIVLAESGRQEPYPATMRRMAAALGVRVLEITEFARAVEYNEPDAAAPK
jgi:transcriptional regulator with XRE-family HTH domain